MVFNGDEGGDFVIYQIWGGDFGMLEYTKILNWLQKVKTMFDTLEPNHLMHFRPHMFRYKGYKAQDVGMLMQPLNWDCPV